MFQVVSLDKFQRILGYLYKCLPQQRASCAQGTALEVVMTRALSVLTGLLPHPCEPPHSHGLTYRSGGKDWGGKDASQLHCMLPGRLHPRC